jgi:hypothetical protein
VGVNSPIKRVATSRLMPVRSRKEPRDLNALASATVYEATAKARTPASPRVLPRASDTEVLRPSVAGPCAQDCATMEAGTASAT